MVGKRCGRVTWQSGASPEQDACSIRRLSGKRRRSRPSHRHAVGTLLWFVATTVQPIHCARQHRREKQYKNLHPITKKSSHTRSLPIRSIVVVELLKRAQVGVAVVDDLRESRIAHTADRLPVSTRQVAHRPPAVHVLAMASGSRCCEQRGEHEMLHDGGRECRQAKEWATALENSGCFSTPAATCCYISRHHDGRDIALWIRLKLPPAILAIAASNA